MYSDKMSIAKSQYFIVCKDFNELKFSSVSGITQVMNNYNVCN